MIEWIVSSTALIAVLILLRFVLKGKISLRLQYTLWSLALIRLLMPFSLGSSGISIMNPVEHSTLYQYTTETVTAIQVPSDTIRDSELTINEAEQAGNGTLHRVEGYSQESGRGHLHTYSFTDSLLAVGGRVLCRVWLCGIVFVGIWFVVSNLRLLYSLKKTRTLLSSGHVLPVYLSDATDTPCLFGLFSPAIYLPPEAAEDATVLRHTVEHETTHYRHRDNLWAILRGVCLAVHWYNPLVWWAALLSRNDAELACDEATIQRLGESERAEYGRTLIAMTCQKRPALLTAATTMTGGRSSIKERITLIARKPKMAVYTLAAVVLIAAVAVGCTFTGAKKADNFADGDYTLYDCDGLTVAIPNEYIDQLIVHTGEELENDGLLISVYEKASVEAAAADGLDDPIRNGLGWLFALLRYDQEQYEQYLNGSHDGFSVFAQDGEWYYCYATATDARFYFGGSKLPIEKALAQWEMLNDQVCPSVRDDFMERNGLTPYSDKVIADDPGNDRPTIPDDLPADMEYLYDFRFSERYDSRVTPDFSLASLGSTVAPNGALSLFEKYQKTGEPENESVYDGDGMVPHLYKQYRYVFQQGALVIRTDSYEPDNVEYISYLWTDLEGVRTNRNIAVGSSEAELLQAYTSDLYFLEQGDTEPSLLAVNEEPNVGVCDYAYAWQPFTQESNELRDITFYMKDGVVAAIEVMEPYELRYVYGYDRAAGLKYADTRRLEVLNADIDQATERIIGNYMSQMMGDDPTQASDGAYSIDGMEQVGNDVIAVVQYHPSMGQGSLYLFGLKEKAGALTVVNSAEGSLPMSMGVELYKAAFFGKTVVFGAVSDQLWLDLEDAPQKVEFTEVKAICSDGTEQSVPVGNDQAFLICMDGDVYVDEVLFLSGSEVAGKLSELPFDEPIEKLNTLGSLYG